MSESTRQLNTSRGILVLLPSRATSSRSLLHHHCHAWQVTLLPRFKTSQPFIFSFTKTTSLSHRPAFTTSPQFLFIVLFVLIPSSIHFLTHLSWHSFPCNIVRESLPLGFSDFSASHFPPSKQLPGFHGHVAPWQPGPAQQQI